MVRSYSFEEFCEKIEASQYFIKDQNLESNYIYSNLNLFGICEGRGKAEAGFTHTNYIFDNFEIDSFVKNEDPLSWDTSFDYHISFLNGQIDKKYTVPHPEELAENEDYYFQSKSQRNQTFFTIISKNTAEIATVQRPQLSYNFPVNSKCKNSFDEMNQKISDSNTNYIETKEKAEELYGEDLSQEKLDFISQNSLSNDTYSFNSFNYYLESEKGVWSIVFQNTLVLNSSLEEKNLDDKKIKVYRFRFYPENELLKNWEIQDCKEFKGNYAGRSVYEFWRKYDSSHIEVLEGRL